MEYSECVVWPPGRLALWYTPNLDDARDSVGNSVATAQRKRLRRTAQLIFPHLEGFPLYHTIICECCFDGQLIPRPHQACFWKLHSSLILRCRRQLYLCLGVALCRHLDIVVLAIRPIVPLVFFHLLNLLDVRIDQVDLRNVGLHVAHCECQEFLGVRR